MVVVARTVVLQGLCVVVGTLGQAGIAAAQGTAGDRPSAAVSLAGIANASGAVTATLDHPGDQDWYLVYGSYTHVTNVSVRRQPTTGPPSCAGIGSLHVELLTPEQQWIVTQVFAPAVGVVVPIPADPSGYYIGVAADDPSCSGLTYVIRLETEVPAATGTPITPRAKRVLPSISRFGDPTCSEARSNLALAQDQLTNDKGRLRRASGLARRRIRNYIGHDRRVVTKWRRRVARWCPRG